MNKLIKLYSLVLLIIAVVFIYQGCSDVDTNIVSPSTASTECTLCHGGNGHVNPPKALNGDTVNTSRGVGAHMMHLYYTDISAKLQCSVCHIPVVNYWDSTHIDRTNPDNRAEITYGPLAKSIIFGGYVPNPVYSMDNLTCTDTYCHGGFAGGNHVVMKFTEPGTAECGTCHGNPSTGNPTPKDYPGYNHGNLTITDCATCHGKTINSSGEINHPENHVNGIVDFNEQ